MNYRETPRETLETLAHEGQGDIGTAGHARAELRRRDQNFQADLVDRQLAAATAVASATWWAMIAAAAAAAGALLQAAMAIAGYLK